MDIDKLKKHCEKTVFDHRNGSGLREEHQAVLDLIKQTEWIKVSDDLPYKDCDCIVWDKYHGKQRILPFNAYHECWDDEDGDDYYTDAVGGNITHWKPTGNRPDKE